MNGLRSTFNPDGRPGRFWAVLLGLACMLAVSLLLTLPVFAGWGEDTRLSSSSYSRTKATVASSTNASIVACGDRIHVVWLNYKESTYNIYYKLSEDAGNTWSADTRLSTNPCGSTIPAIAVSGNNVYVVWSGSSQTFCRSSGDGGKTWGTDSAVSTVSATVMPVIAVSDYKVHLAWSDDRQLFYKFSSDNARTWGADIGLASLAYSTVPSIAVNENNVHIVWADTSHIYYKYSADNGHTWAAEIELGAIYSSAEPSIAAAGNDVYVTWQDYADSNNDSMQIYYMHSPDCGKTWSLRDKISSSPAYAYAPSIAASGSNVHVAWFDERDGNNQIYYNGSADGGLSWGQDARLSQGAAGSMLPCLALTGNDIHVVWQDIRDVRWEIYYRKFTGDN